MARTINDNEYKIIGDIIENYFILNKIPRDNINILLSREDFILSVIISDFDPIYIEYIGLKPIYNNIQNDFTAKRWIKRKFGWGESI